MELTQALLKELLTYEVDTGLFRWKKPRPKIRVGEVAGCSTNAKGAVKITILGRSYYAHRLAWLYTYGMWPKDQIDHKDLNKSNNRLDNLREATNGQNCANRRVFGRSGLKGVVYNSLWGRKPWRAQITINKKCYVLGYFESSFEAHATYAAKASEIHGEFARTS